LKTNKKKYQEKQFGWTELENIGTDCNSTGVHRFSGWAL